MKNLPIMEKVKLILWLLGAGYLIYFLFNLVIVLIKLPETMGNTTFTHAGNLTYPGLFKKEITDKFERGVIYSPYSKNKVNTFDYAGKFDLVIHKICDLKTKSIDEIMTMDGHSSRPHSTTAYELVHQSLYTLEFMIEKKEKEEPLSKFFLSIYGDSLKTIVHNDTLISYNLKLKSFSLRYQPEGINEIVGEVEGIFAPKVPYSLLIYKKDNAIYLMTMAPKNRKTKMDPNLLTSLITGK